MNRRQRRAMKNVPRKFSETDMRRAAREAALSTGRHSTQMTLAAVCLALHEMHGFGTKRLTRVLETVQDITMQALCASELVDRLKEEVGVVLCRDEDL